MHTKYANIIAISWFLFSNTFFRWKLTTVQTLLQQTSLRFAIVLWCWSLILLWRDAKLWFKGLKNAWVTSAKGGCSTRGPIPKCPWWGVIFEGSNLNSLQIFQNDVLPRKLIMLNKLDLFGALKLAKAMLLFTLAY